MSSGRPDFHPTMLLEGKRLTSLIPVAVDPLGQLYTVMSGVHAGVSTPVLVDENGQIVAVIKGEYLGEPATVALDENGLIKVNLTVQDLNYLKVRPVYGKAVVVSEFGIALPGLAWKDVLDVTGRGAILSCYLEWLGTSSFESSYARVVIDGDEYLSQTIELMLIKNMLHSESSLFYLKQHNSIDTRYAMGIRPGITFETSCKISLYNQLAPAYTCSYEVVYALVP